MSHLLSKLPARTDSPAVVPSLPTATLRHLSSVHQTFVSASSGAAVPAVDVQPKLRLRKLAVDLGAQVDSAAPVLTTPVAAVAAVASLAALELDDACDGDLFTPADHPGAPRPECVPLLRLEKIVEVVFLWFVLFCYKCSAARCFCRACAIGS